MSVSYHNLLLMGFVASDSKIIVYLKQNEETGEYAVKVRNGNNNVIIVTTTSSLSSAMRDFAETIAQYTNGFTVWNKLN